MNKNCIETERLILKNTSKEQETDFENYAWTIHLKDGTVIGKIELPLNLEYPKKEFKHRPGYPEEIEVRDFSLYIVPEFRKNGYASEAAFAIFDLIFYSEIKEVEIRTKASDKEDSTCGFMEEFMFSKFKVPFNKKDGTKYALEEYYSYNAFNYQLYYLYSTGFEGMETELKR